MQRSHEDKRTILITGGTQGIGLALANGYAASGWNVISLGLQPNDHSSAPKGVETHFADVTDQSAVQSVVDSLQHLDALINAAGMIVREKEFEIDTFQQVVDVNLTSAMRVSTCCVEKLAARGGTIVNIASMLSFFGGGLVPAYSASKGGIVQLTKSLAIAWAKHGIRVNAIAPGWIETPMTKALREDESRATEIRNRTPMRRWGKPEELLGPVQFLTSDAASFVTGAILTVDGGYSCY